MSKYSSSKFAVFLADGYSLLSAKLKGASLKIEAGQADTTGLGDAWTESTATGVRKGTLTQSGGFFDDTANRIHEAFRNAQGVSRILCVGPAGNVIGRLFYGFCGVFGMAYEVLGKLGNLTEANVTYTVSGAVDEGLILQEWATRTDDWNTATEGNSVDGAAASSAGGVGYLEVSDFAGPNALACSIIHSPDLVNWSDLVPFVSVTGAQTAQRLAVTGTVHRYLAFKTLGFGNLSASVSTSASVSPSVSASVSSSASRSPSASISPSGSTSLSPSSSVSPSASTSLSPSSSVSPSGSTSLSPSSSVSPSSSRSASASASPSAGAGPASSVTLFAGFKRS